jgi:uncharacterized membrane protein YfhO
MEVLGRRREGPDSDYGGLIAVQLPDSADRIDCTYTPPGLRRGLALAGAAALITLGIVLFGLIRRRIRS